MSPLSAWILAIRPKTLPVAVAPVAVGAAVAHASGPWQIGPVLAALWGALFIQIGANLANDVFDHEKGADSPDRLGPLRVTQAGLLSPTAMRIGMSITFALAALAGLYLTAVAGWPIVAIGVASIASAIAYTGGPWPLGYHGLGDVFVFAFFGLAAVCGTVFVASGSVVPLGWWAAVPVGALATAVLVVNNVRDFPTDARAGKRTLVVRLGRNFGVAEYAALVAIAYLVPVGLAVSGTSSRWVLLPLLTAPLAVRLVRILARETDGPILNGCLANTAKLMLAHGALFAVGMIL